jgi:NADH-quinone oxidoreductase subunit G
MYYTIIINSRKIAVPLNSNILNAAKSCGLCINRFCYHENLPIAGNCRFCLVEVENLEKPIASCVAEVEPSLIV